MHPPSTARRAAALLFAFLALGTAWVALHAHAGPPLPSAADPARAAAPAAPHDVPCSLEASRDTAPLVIEEQGTVDIDVAYNYSCPVGNRKVYFFLLVENSRELDRSGRSGRSLLANVRDGLADFVNQIDYGLGSQGGMILFSRTHTVRVPLPGESAGKQTLINAIRSFPVGAGTTATGVAGAIDEAARLLQAADPDGNAFRIILILQAGAPTTGAGETIDDACAAAKAGGATIGLLFVDGVTNPLEPCASPLWSRNSPRADGDDIPRILSAMGTAAVTGHQALRVEYCDDLAPEFRFVDGSGLPRPPDVTVLDQICWTDDAPPPPEGHVLRYRLRAAAVDGGSLGPTSNEAEVRLVLGDGRIVERPLPLPDMCVYPEGRPDFCEPFARTLTPAAPTAETPATAPPPETPGEPPTDTPTAATPDDPTTATADTPSPTTSPAEDTPVPGQGWRLWIPSAKRGAM